MPSYPHRPAAQQDQNVFAWGANSHYGESSHSDYLLAL